MNNLLIKLQEHYKAGIITKELFEEYSGELTSSTQVELPCKREELFVRQVDMDEYRLFGKLDEEELQQLYDNNLNEFKIYVAEGYNYSQAINWNKYNELKSKGVTYHFNIMKPFVKLPRINGAYTSSCFEAHLMLNTVLAFAEYEPKEFKLQYYVIKNYNPDFIFRKYPEIYWEAKGILRDRAEGDKYKSVSKQHEKPIVFVFQAVGIMLMWQKPRVDGTRQTQEEWCDANGYLYTYGHEVDEFVQTKIFQDLLREWYPLK